MHFYKLLKEKAHLWHNQCQVVSRCGLITNIHLKCFIINVIITCKIAHWIIFEITLWTKEEIREWNTIIPENSHLRIGAYSSMLKTILQTRSRGQVSLWSPLEEEGASTNSRYLYKTLSKILNSRVAIIRICDISSGPGT